MGKSSVSCFLPTRSVYVQCVPKSHSPALRRECKICNLLPFYFYFFRVQVIRRPSVDIVKIFPTCYTVYRRSINRLCVIVCRMSKLKDLSRQSRREAAIPRKRCKLQSSETIYTVRQKKTNQFSFFVHLFQYLTETGDFFTYIKPKESSFISYNFVYLILASVENFAATFYVYQSSNEINDYGLVFIVSISLLRKILNACQN